MKTVKKAVRVMMALLGLVVLQLMALLYVLILWPNIIFEIIGEWAETPQSAKFVGGCSTVMWWIIAVVVLIVLL